MNFYKNLPRLETERLIIRPAALSDAPDVYAYASDPEVVRFLRWGPHASLAQTEAYLRDVLAEYAGGRDSPWLIELKSSRAVVGSIHLMQLDLPNRRAQVGFTLAKAYWDRGLATEALERVLQYVFTDLGLEQVEAWPIRENLPARRVLEKAGFHPEGDPQAEIQKGATWYFCRYVIERRTVRESDTRLLL